ncbi:MAG: universal stress protein [Nitrososphaerota archaeon]|jgi:nucleotide-binding universal stress UspA family protein|nr:universal stress protein [Nitrososphaerota archaeon]MDG6924238.1 universal stress protein [Nitrososphaerota archaeon]
MSPIVVAVDGSKHCEKVVDFACELAKDMNISIVLINVIRRMPDEPERIKAFEESEHCKGAFATYLEQLGKSVTAPLRR